MKFTFSKKQKSFGNKRFLEKYFDAILVWLFIIIILFGFYLLYTLTYATFFSVTSVDPSQVESQQEKIDINKFNQVLNGLEDKERAGVNSPKPLFNR